MMMIDVSGDTLPVVNVTQLEKDTVLICYDREFSQGSLPLSKSLTWTHAHTCMHTGCGLTTSTPQPFKPTGMLVFDCQSSPSGPHVWLPEQSFWTPFLTARAVPLDPMFDCQSSPSGPHVWLPEQSFWTPCLTARAVPLDPMFDCQCSP